MDASELRKKIYDYTDMSAYYEDPAYVKTNDIISDQEDLHQFGIRVLSDRRPDPRTMELDQKQENTDSVAQIRQQYSGTGLRYGDDPRNYGSELFLEMTEKDPRRTFVDPDFREVVKFGFAKQKYYKTMLFPEDPLTGSLTQGQLSPAGITIQKLDGREQSKNYFKSVLEDSLDGTEPRRQFRQDDYSYIDKALANQGDLPYADPLRNDKLMSYHPMAAKPDRPVVGWTDGDVVFNVAKLGRSASAHISAADAIRMRDSQTHKADPSMAEKDRTEKSSDSTIKYSSARITSDSLNDVIRKVVDSSIKTESMAARAANRGMEWGSIQENVRRALDNVIGQVQMQQQADIINKGGIRGSVVRVDGGAADRLAKQQIDLATNSTMSLLAQFKDMFNKASLSMASIVGNTVTAENIKQEVNQINENWRMELANMTQKTRSSLMDNIQGMNGNVVTTNPWYDHTGKSLEVANYRTMVPKDMKKVYNYGLTQQGFLNTADDATGRLRGAGRSSGDTNSMVYAANQGVPFRPEMIAESGSMGGIAAPLTSKQKVRFDTNESSSWVSDVMDIGEETGRQTNYGRPKY